MAMQTHHSYGSIPSSRSCRVSYLILFSSVVRRLISGRFSSAKTSSMLAAVIPEACWRCGENGECQKSIRKRGNLVLSSPAEALAQFVGLHKVLLILVLMCYCRSTAWDFYQAVAVRTTTVKLIVAHHTIDFYARRRLCPALPLTMALACIFVVRNHTAWSRRGRRLGRIKWRLWVMRRKRSYYRLRLSACVFDAPC